MEAILEGKVVNLLKAFEVARAAGELGEAISHISAAIFLKPRDAYLYAERADAYLEICDFSTALANMQKAVALTERRDAALLRKLAYTIDARGLTMLDEGDYASAITAFSEALELVQPPAKLEASSSAGQAGREPAWGRVKGGKTDAGDTGAFANVGNTPDAEEVGGAELPDGGLPAASRSGVH
ncbi:hypothetical protein T492DRAFT_845769 [Pavlovales sp. CCMP2436]|nr:hypothetical protein T492DRAFT_845769 [Pavlovales sp. CCMP2436]